MKDQKTKRKPHPNKGKNLYAELTPEQKENHKNAMSGNTFWQLAENPGRPKIFDSIETALQTAKNYLDWCKENPIYVSDFIRSGEQAGEIVQIPKNRIPTITGFCVFAGVDTKTFYNYEKNENYKDFFQMFSHVRDLFNSEMEYGAVSGAANAMIAARILGLKEKHDITSNDSNFSLTVEFKNKDEIRKIGESLENEV